MQIKEHVTYQKNHIHNINKKYISREIIRQMNYKVKEFIYFFFLGKKCHYLCGHVCTLPRGIFTPREGAKNL